MPWYEYINNANIADFIAMLWRDYSIIIGFAGTMIGFIVKHTKTKKDDRIWADFKAMVLARKASKK